MYIFYGVELILLEVQLNAPLKIVAESRGKQSTGQLDLCLQSSVMTRDDRNNSVLILPKTAPEVTSLGIRLLRDYATTAGVKYKMRMIFFLIG